MRRAGSETGAAGPAPALRRSERGETLGRRASCRDAPVAEPPRSASARSQPLPVHLPVRGPACPASSRTSPSSVRVPWLCRRAVRGRALPSCASSAFSVAHPARPGARAQRAAHGDRRLRGLRTEPLHHTPPSVRKCLRKCHKALGDVRSGQKGQLKCLETGIFLLPAFQSRSIPLHILTCLRFFSLLGFWE